MIESTGAVKLLRFSNLSACESCVHLVTTRFGGVSASPYNALNLGFHVDDDPEHVKENRMRVLAAAGVPSASLTTAKQVHGARVAVVTADTVGSGAVDYASALEATDALVTDVPGACLMVFVADCVPILLFDPARKVAAAVHAGWKGTELSIAERAVETMRREFGSDPGGILAGIGPSIGPCCYQVGPEAAARFEAVGGLLSRIMPDGRAHLDLWEANRLQLVKAGLREEVIECSRMCTRCRSDLFFSARAAVGPTGRFGAGVMVGGT